MNPEISKFFEENRNLKPQTYKKSKTATEVIKESLLPYLPIVGFNPPVEQMYEEAKRLIPMMISHRADYENHAGWKSLVLHGLGATMTEGAERYGKDPEDKSIYGWTEISELAPVTTAFFRDAFHYHHYQRIRFMLLEPGGYICPHTDFNYYTLGPINMALNNPVGCEFVMKGFGVVPFKAGTINKLALINQHAVYNNSDEARIHMIIHGAPNPDHWAPLIVKSYDAFVSSRDLQPIGL